MSISVPYFDRSKPFSRYVICRKSRFCISLDDLGDYWVSSFDVDYPSYFIGPYTLAHAITSFNQTVENYNHLEVNFREK